MKTSEQINEIAKAMSLVQKEMKPAIKDSVNPHFKSRFCDLESVWGAIRIPLTANNLTVWQDVISEEKGVSVITRIVHHTGQWVEFGPLTIPLSKFDAQAVGSATSYAKRYSLCAALGVVGSDEDDDGEKAMPKALPSLNDSQFEEFYMQWCEIYTDPILKGYLDTKAKKYKMTLGQVAFSAAKDTPLFEKEIQSYIKWIEEKNAKA